MASLNQCNFIGNVGKLETRYMPNGDAVTNISLAINESWKDKNGDKQEKTEWVNIVFYKRLAEVVAEYVTSGSPLFVSGRMATKKWEKDGVTRYSTEIIADQMQMLGSRNAEQAQGDSDAPRAEESQPKAQEMSDRGTFDDMGDDVPF